MHLPGLLITTLLLSKKQQGVEFRKHLTDEVCEFLIIGTRYFDFKGRSDLIKTIRSFVPESHYLLIAVKRSIYNTALDQLSALRNFAAHESSPSKRAALKAINAKRIKSSGAWLKKQNRFMHLVESLKNLAQEIETTAPY